MLLKILRREPPRGETLCCGRRSCSQFGSTESMSLCRLRCFGGAASSRRLERDFPGSIWVGGPASERS